jgi:hypothetical protein
MLTGSGIRYFNSILTGDRSVTKVYVEPGACGLTCLIEASRTEKKYGVTVRLQSQCKQITELGSEIAEVDFMNVMRGAFGQNQIFQSVPKCKLHQSCVIPSAIIKAMEAEVGMAVKKDIKITFTE